MVPGLFRRLSRKMNALRFIYHSPGHPTAPGFVVHILGYETGRPFRSSR